MLNESEELSAADRRLGQIIHEQSGRIDRVIENVLQLSRRREAQPELLDLKTWLEHFVAEFRSSAAPNQAIHIEISPGTLTTRMDSGQLTQIMTNLLQNGLRYSGKIIRQRRSG